MSDDLTWEVRREAAGRESRQKGLAKARFYWKKDGQVVRSAEFTQSELEAECERLSEAGSDITQFALALLALSASAGQSASTGQAQEEGARLDPADQRRRA
jgi:hypothetical protein